MYEDWGLIEASFTAQYGIRLRNEKDMSWSEFSTLLSGIMPETPLGKVVSIRSENDKDVLKNFTKEQHKLRNEWRNRNIKRIVIMDKKEVERQTQIFQDMCKKAFSK
ncbi:Bacteriophage Gp15 protein [Tissierella praeacuta DSM 18095]|uniref:Bacteriophage Gp15 protein n=1 Tax=Tissierella praeacuta DSM 18095 TaxID=1123404 RepID=A0A1M4ZC38_9FIRM|nr:bacteriophage Gp15 protein [Tissierella praeacuta]SHF15571.1 Bacteriophage Gp15 protein [Tissierella praeacuta DSM 18095]SUO99568.1 Bacteriophage Gp15 protein [Tissierella praeacuta]